MPNPTPQAVAFLDFDGVIRVAIEGGWIGPDSMQFCQVRMKTLRKVAQLTGVRYVVSSDWRNCNNRREIEGLLTPYLNDLLHDDWATPICGKRWIEIQAWLTRHPEVTRYAILDDFAQHFEGAPAAMLERLLLCTNRHGLTPEIANRLIAAFP